MSYTVQTTSKYHFTNVIQKTCLATQSLHLYPIEHSSAQEQTLFRSDENSCLPFSFDSADEGAIIC